jgi:hypothetical protein
MFGDLWYFDVSRKMTQLSSLLYFYGIFLILCGIVSVIFIGLKAKTALLSGGTSGVLALLCGYGILMDVSAARIGGILLSAMLFVVFSWRSAKTLFRVVELVNSPGEELKGKLIAFLIISLMAVVSLFILVLQIVR